MWNILQKRNFRYSSVSNTSLSSNVVFSQRVRTFDDALNSSQINCVDGSVLFASLLRAINIEPILVRIPGHMFVGYYTDNGHKNMDFLETTMIGDVDLDDFFPDERLDSTMVGKTQNQMSRITFDKSKEYANRKYKQYEGGDSLGQAELHVSGNIEGCPAEDTAHRSVNRFLQASLANEPRECYLCPTKSEWNHMMEQQKKYISPGAWFSMQYPATWNEFEDGEGSFLFIIPRNGRETSASRPIGGRTITDASPSGRN